MPNFKRDFGRREFDSRDSGGSRGRGGFGGRSRGGFGGGRGRDRPEMHDVVCDKCGKDCQVPFKPTGDKPVFCSNCYEKEDGGRSRSFEDRGRRSSSGSDQSSGGASGISKEQFDELNTKLDKILGILEMIEFEDGDEDDEESEDEEETEEAVK